MKIGWITVEVAFDLDRPHESPAQYHTIRVEPGIYPVEVRESRGRCCIYWYVVVVWTGKVVASGYGSRRYREVEGTEDIVTTQPYKYELRSGQYMGQRVTLTDDKALDQVRGV